MAPSSDRITGLNSSIHKPGLNNQMTAEYYWNMLRFLQRYHALLQLPAETGTSNPYAGKYLLNDCLVLEKKYLDLLMQISPNGNIEAELLTYAHGELKTCIPSTNELFGPAYRFQFLNDAILHMLLWLSLQFVYPLIRQCWELPMADVSHSSPADEIPDESELFAEFYVKQAIRSLPYCGQGGMNPWSIHYGVLIACSAARKSF